MGFGEDWQEWAHQPCLISFSTITDHFRVLCPKISVNLSIWQHQVPDPPPSDLGNLIRQHLFSAMPLVRELSKRDKHQLVQSHRKENRNPSIFTLFFPSFHFTTFSALQDSTLVSLCKTDVGSYRRTY